MILLLIRYTIYNIPYKGGVEYMRRVVIHIFGQVQMVGFRYATLRKAEELSLSGYVKNLRDGSVEIKAEGEEEKISKLLEWCNKGPHYSKVKKVIVGEMELENSKGDFKIL